MRDGVAARVSSVTRWVRRHWLFTALLAGGAALRVLATFAYQPALFFYDSKRYLGALDTLDSGDPGPLGYSILLLGPVLELADHLMAAAIANHLIGLLMGVGGYLLLLRWGAWRWLAALAVAPVLLDAYQVQIEQMIMSDTLFVGLLLLGLLILARRHPGHVAAGAAGLVFALGSVTRLAGIACIVMAVGYLLLAGRTWRRRVTTSLAAVAFFAVPVAGYVLYHEARYPPEREVANAHGMTLYSRVAPVADCSVLDVPDYQRVLCEERPPEQRPGPEFYHWDPQRPAKKLDPPPGVTRGEAVTDFTLRVVRNQPLDVVGAVAHDFVRGFWWAKETQPGEPPADRWEFPLGAYEYSGNKEAYQYYLDIFGGERQTNRGIAEFLVAYQDTVFVRGTIVGAFLVVGLAGAVGVGRVRRSAMRPVVALAVALPVSCLLLAAGVEFSWRYQLPGIVLLPIAAALGVVAMWKRTEEDSVVSTAPVATADGTDAEALRDFAERYPDATFSSVLVVVAAYNEEAGIGQVVDSVPDECYGLGVQTLVVDDKSEDATVDVARAHGAYVCSCPRNRGQGAALRLGYQLARERDAHFVVTTDADGQYDMAELPLLIQPLLDGKADFVTGSRVLGSHQATDLTRRIGTRVFAGLVSGLTGMPITDTSFGFRAMRAQLTGEVALTQPQYQSSELLIGVLSAGYRVVEQPMSMLRRNHGATKKGNNLFYGWRYTRVVFGTWWRERSRRNSRSSSTNRAAKSTP